MMHRDVRVKTHNDGILVQCSTSSAAQTNKFQKGYYYLNDDVVSVTRNFEAGACSRSTGTYLHIVQQETLALLDPAVSYIY